MEEAKEGRQKEVEVEVERGRSAPPPPRSRLLARSLASHQSRLPGIPTSESLWIDPRPPLARPDPSARPRAGRRAIRWSRRRRDLTPILSRRRPDEKKKASRADAVFFSFANEKKLSLLAHLRGGRRPRACPQRSSRWSSLFRFFCRGGFGMKDREEQRGVSERKGKRQRRLKKNACSRQRRAR